MGLISLGNLHLSLWKEKKKKNHLPSFKKEICSTANWTSVFFPSSLQSSIHACSYIPLLTRLQSTTFFLFLPFSHPSVTTYTSLTHFKFVRLLLSPTAQTHTPPPPLAHFVRLPVSVCSAYTRSHSLCPLAWHPSTGALLRRTYFVFPRCGWYRMFVFQLWLHHFLIFPLVAETSLNPPPAFVHAVLLSEWRRIYF